MTYVTNYMRKELEGHSLKLLVDGDVMLYRMGRPDTSVYVVYIADLVHRLCITGDICLGQNQNGLVSNAGYRISWFAGQLSECYLCEKFLRREWQWDAAVEIMQDHMKIETEDGDGWWMEHAEAIRAFIDSPGWKYDAPNDMEYYERMVEIGHDGCELPGYDYPRIEAGWLCAIQQRFRELYPSIGTQNPE